MGVLNEIVEKIHEHYGEIWIQEGEDSKQYFKGFIRRTQCKAKILTGEFDPSFYEQQDVIDCFRDVLKQERDLLFIYNKGACNKSKGIEKLRKENPRIVGLKKQFSEQLYLYWQKKRSPIHFSTVDSKHIFIEDPHFPYEERRVLIKYRSVLLAGKWDKVFDRLLETECEEISTNDLSEAKN